jgi:hypothetical protein
MFCKFYQTIKADGTDSLIYSRPQKISLSSAQTPQLKGMCIDRQTEEKYKFINHTDWKHQASKQVFSKFQKIETQLMLQTHPPLQIQVMLHIYMQNTGTAAPSWGGGVFWRQREREGEGQKE